MPAVALTIHSGTCMPALLTRASMQAETLASSVAEGAPLSQPWARPIEPAKVKLAPSWSALTSFWLLPRAHDAMYAAVRRPMAVVMRPLVDDSPFVLDRPLVSDSPLELARPFTAARPFANDSPLTIDRPLVTA